MTQNAATISRARAGVDPATGRCGRLSPAGDLRCFPRGGSLGRSIFLNDPPYPKARHCKSANAAECGSFQSLTDRAGTPSRLVSLGTPSQIFRASDTASQRFHGAFVCFGPWSEHLGVLLSAEEHRREKHTWVRDFWTPSNGVAA